jgi:hypothetical protein
MLSARSLALIALIAYSSAAVWATPQTQISSLTTTYTTTLGVTYDYLTSSEGSTFMQGYVTYSRSVGTTTITGSSLLTNPTVPPSTSRTGQHSSQTFPAFYLESLALGFVVVLFTVFWMRFHREA